MSKTHDTIDGLLAEFRGYSAGMPPSYHVTMSWADFRKMLDRLDAAHRREADYAREAYESALKAEREALREQYEAGALVDGTRGDCAKLREAVEFIKQYFDKIDPFNINTYTFSQIEVEHINEAIDAAVAAPPRNCDKYATADEALKAQEQMFNDSNFANGECKLGCPECDNPRVGCKIAWLFAPATEKEGGNNADK